jgi:clan AA aspartic protease (TIGR02281 family)
LIGGLPFAKHVAFIIRTALLFTVLTAPLTQHGCAQTIKTKDGVALGQRAEFIRSCIDGVKKGTMNFKGIEVETANYCSCVCDNLIPQLYSWELERAMEQDKVEELFLTGDNLNTIIECSTRSMRIKEGEGIGYNNNGVSTTIIENCILAFRKNPEAREKFTYGQTKQYCECAVQKMASTGLTFEEISMLNDKSSQAYNEIILPCLGEMLADEEGRSPLQGSINNDIAGSMSKCSIPLMDDLGKGYKVKLTLGGITRYYLLDTGASHLIINKDMERELLLDGKLSRSDYQADAEYIMANGERFRAHKVKVNNVQIGDFTLKNVEVAVVDNGGMLLGNSILNKFSKWEIDKSSMRLILYR